MNRHLLILASFLALIMTCCTSSKKQGASFSFVQTDEGLALTENGKPVLFYQKKPKSLTGQYVCSNYIHPLYDLRGDTLTEEFPPDHPYHRGIFWAWHQLYVDNKSIGDGWINDVISQDVASVLTEKDQTKARFRTDVNWRSSSFQDGKPFMNEITSVTVYQAEADMRKIDFEINLKALVNGLQIGGSADEKGYGGFCVRLNLKDSLKFTSENGPVTPRELQIKAGPWMDFSGIFGRSGEVSGLTVISHPGTPDYPEAWILRQKTSMQNVVFPGQNRIDLPVGKPVILHYRVIIHNGNAGSLDMKALQEEYSEMYGDK